MVVLEKVDKAKALTLSQLAQQGPEYVNHITEALSMLIAENEMLRKIASKYSHDLRSPVTNIDMLLQLYDKTEENGDKQLYIQKMGKSVTRLQDGFEALSAERKNALVDKGKQTIVALDEALEEVRQNISKNIVIATDFSGGKKVVANPQKLVECLSLLTSPFGEETTPYTIEVSTEKTWDGVILSLKYPDFLSLSATFANISSQENTKATEKSNELLGWNYYFAVLFFRAMGATTSIEESTENQTKVLISFTQ